jgi:hypothetical protein
MTRHPKRGSLYTRHDSDVQSEKGTPKHVAMKRRHTPEGAARHGKELASRQALARRLGKRRAFERKEGCWQALVFVPG